MKKWLMVLALCSMAFGFANDNYTGYGDTSNVPGFKSNLTKYSKWFRLSAYLNSRLDIMANDTSSAGFASDSVKFIWGIQTGHPVYNASGARDTVISKMKIVLDTFDVKSGWLPDTLIQVGTDYSFSQVQGLVDTVNVTGYAVQTSNFAPEWDVWIRGFATGLSGNKVGSYVKILFSLTRKEKNP
jgi:hypothetical protein